MSQFENTTTQATALTNHDRIPIHIPGSIQPHGVLLALSTQLEILKVSNNTQAYLGKEPEDLLGQPLSYLLDARQVDTLKQCLVKKIGSANAFKVLIVTLNGERYFDAIAHRTEELSYEEIAATLGIKVGTVRSRIHRGRVLLREALAHRAPGVRPVEPGHPQPVPEAAS